jgi:heptosyltransferase-1
VTTWGDEQERALAGALARDAGVEMLPRRPLGELAPILAGFRAVVAADTGLAHLSAALGVPTVGLYGATDPCRTGVRGRRVSLIASRYHCAPCLQRSCTEDPDRRSELWPPCLGTVTPDAAWTALEPWLTPDSTP